MCDYCENLKELKEDWSDLETETFVDDDDATLNVTVTDKNSTEWSVQYTIKYCPMCGKKL